MSNNKNNLKNRFDNFEPEVDESHIEKNWQKIKEQLPKGKKDSKKGLFNLFLSIGLILFTGAGIVIYFNTSNQNNSADNFNTNTTIAKQSTDQNTSNNHENMVIANGQKVTLNNQNKSHNDNKNQSSDDAINSDIQTNRNKSDQFETTI